jgi:soluble cytochrome b562
MFRKYSAYLAGVEYILKLGEEDYPELPGTEFLCNQIAEELGINVPSYFLIDFFDQKTFASRVFINKHKKMILHHIYHYLREEDDFSVQSLIRIIEEHTGRLSEVEKFIDITLFDALIGNHDRHGRNLAFLEEKGKLILSPCYDNPSYIGIESDFLLGAHHSPRGKIATTTTDEPTMKDYAQEFLDMGFEEAVHDFFKRVNIDNIKQLVAKGLVSEARKAALMRIILARLEELRYACGLP